jgi:3-dehydroquinate dehydratase
MEKYDPEVYKIAMMPKTEEDVNIMYRLTEHFKQNYI